MAEIISRAEAKAQGLKHYFTGKPCKHGHITERRTANGFCSDCERENRRTNREVIRERARKRLEDDPDYHRRYYRKNREYHLEYARKYREKNRETITEKARKRHWEDRDAIVERRRKNRQKNREAYLERGRKYRQENRERYNAHCAKRRAAKLKRTIPGFDNEIQTVYSEAARRREQGEDVHVDHVIPLQGETVSGLHVPWNLEIIPSHENLSKGNRFDGIIEDTSHETC